MSRRLSQPPLWGLGAAGFAAFIILGQTTPSFGWGHNGHRIVAKFAETRLSGAARVAVHDLLEDAEDIADASTYPDEHKTPADAPWHYVNVPLGEDSYDAKFCDAKKQCVVQKIKDFRAVLKDEDASALDKRRALRFLVHLVGDIHQPLHVADNGDRGGNSVHLQFFGRGTNLHAVWDEYILFYDPSNDQDELGRGVDEGSWVTRLTKFTTKEKADKWIATAREEDWATESLLLAKQAYKTVPSDPSSDDIKKGKSVRLADEYETDALPIVEQRLAQAGVRLANVLNDIFGSD